MQPQRSGFAVVPVTHVSPALGTLPLLHSAHKTSSVPSERQNLHPFKKREKLVCPAWAGQEKGFERVNLGLEHDCGQTHNTRTTRLDGCKEHPSAGAREPLQAPSRMLSASTGLQIPTLGKAKKTQSSPAHDQSLPGQHVHSHPPPFPQPLCVLHPACFCRETGPGASSSAPGSPPAPTLLGALSPSRVCVGPTTHGDSSGPPTLALRLWSFRSRTFAAVGPQGKEQRSHFHL